MEPRLVRLLEGGLVHLWTHAERPWTTYCGRTAKDSNVDYAQMPAEVPTCLRCIGARP